MVKNHIRFREMTLGRLQAGMVPILKFLILGIMENVDVTQM